MTTETTETTAPVLDQTADEFFETLNGFDEIAVAKHFGSPPVELTDTNKIAFARSLIFVAQRRAGQKDGEAYKYAMNATVGEVNRYFAEDEEEAMPEDPITDSGKGDSGDETTPKS